MEQESRRNQKVSATSGTVHIGVGDQGQIVASTVTVSHEQEPSQVPELLTQIDGDIECFVGGVQAALALGPDLGIEVDESAFGLQDLFVQPL